MNRSHQHPFLAVLTLVYVSGTGSRLLAYTLGRRLKYLKRWGLWRRLPAL